MVPQQRAHLKVFWWFKLPAAVEADCWGTHFPGTQRYSQQFSWLVWLTYILSIIAWIRCYPAEQYCQASSIISLGMYLLYISHDNHSNIPSMQWLYHSLTFYDKTYSEMAFLWHYCIGPKYFGRHFKRDLWNDKFSAWCCDLLKLNEQKSTAMSHHEPIFT